MFVQDGADDVESAADRKQQEADPLQELSVLQFLKSKSPFCLLPV